jgi:hypothetical protein
MQKIKRSMPLVAIIGILFATGIVFSQAFIAQKNQTKLGTPIALGDDDEEGGEVESDDNESDDNKDEVDKEENDDNSDEEKDDDQEERRTTVRTSTTTRVRNTTTVRKQEVDDENENEQDDKDGEEKKDQEDLAELKQDVAKVEANIAKLSQAGISVEPFSAPLAEIKGLVAQIEAKITANADEEALLETADKKLERLDKLVKIALGDKEDDEDGKENNDDKDEEVAKTYKNNVAQFVHNLKELGEIEGGIGQQVKVVAQAQNDTQAKVEESISDVENRNGFLKFIVGPDYSGIANVQTAITENQTRIKVLSDLLNQITDPAVKLVLQGQVESLQQQNEKLQSFVNTSSEGASLFGWLVKLFQ